MKFALTAPLGPYGYAENYDIHAIKTALNQLGYYTPPMETGIEEMRDPALFKAINAFQKDNDIAPDDHLMPRDATATAIDEGLKSQDPAERYVWRTVGDSRVRDEHATRDGQIYTWGNPPEGGHPGEDYNCRCWAEPIEDGIQPVYPEFILIPALKFGRIIKMIKEFYEAKQRTGYTNHGNIRSSQRNISTQEIEEAIKSAKENGNVITKTGKYGTLQNHYKGSNGVTVVIETSGRNAGKIITVWTHK